jgi:hypothetical protein
VDVADDEQSLVAVSVVRPATAVATPTSISRPRDMSMTSYFQNGGPTGLNNGGDNIGVYVPVFAVAGVGGMVVNVVAFGP